ncbi:MAG TPA: hypothetical protein VFC17_00940 [Candidatus Limnocylindrales bacterium]|nr:hypothetical protein [Candidatus Limnocylindrales bacterium]
MKPVEPWFLLSCDELRNQAIFGGTIAGQSHGVAGAVVHKTAWAAKSGTFRRCPHRPLFTAVPSQLLVWQQFFPQSSQSTLMAGDKVRRPDVAKGQPFLQNRRQN